MESDEVRRQIREIERGEAASWLHFAGHEWWQPLGLGAWAGVFVLSMGLLDGGTRSLALLALIAAPLLYGEWDRRRRAVYPQSRMPREMWRSTAALLILSPGVAILAATAYFAAGVGVAAATAAVATTVLVELYGRVYVADAERVRRRLA